MPAASKIYIAGGGSIDDSFQYDELFFKSLPKNATILYVPTAMATTPEREKAAYAWFLNLLSAHSADEGTIDFDMWDSVSPPKNMSAYDAIYVGGGNTYYLLDRLKKTGMMDVLQKYIRGGGIYYGGSAGAVILGKSLRTVQQENKMNSYEHQGADLISGMSVYPHYVDSERNRTHIQNLCGTYRLKIIALSETSGVILENKNIRVVGSAYVFEDGKETAVHSSREII